MNEHNFDSLFSIIKFHTYLSEGKLQSLIRICEYLNTYDIPGDYVECGTYKGGAAAALSTNLGTNRHLWLYDSFQGMPQTIERDGDEASQWVGECLASPVDVEEVLQRVGTHPDQYTIRAGWFHDSFQKPTAAQVALLHCDADWYQSVTEVLEKFYDVIPDGGCVVLDDFGYWEGCREAFYDFCHRRGEYPLLERIETDQAFWIKGRTSNRQPIPIFYRPSSKLLQTQNKLTQLLQDKARLETVFQSRIQNLEVQLSKQDNDFQNQLEELQEKLQEKDEKLQKTRQKLKAERQRRKKLQTMKPVCPLTGTDDVSLIQEFDCDGLVDDWQKYFQIDISEELKGHRKIYLYRSNPAKFDFFVPSSTFGSQHLYAQLEKYDWYYMEDKWEYSIALGDLQAPQSVLEIGSGYGYFVKHCLNAGLSITGIELNQKAVKLAQEQHLPVNCTDLKTVLECQRASFDAVCSFQVLEHVAQPRQFLNQAIQALKPGGKLILCVPNPESFLKYQYCLLDMPPHHMHRWRAETFKYLETIFPLKLESVNYEPLAPYHASGYLDAYSQHYRNMSPLGRLFFNSKTLPFYQSLLNKDNIRNLLRGQSLYVRFRKTG